MDHLVPDRAWEAEAYQVFSVSSTKRTSCQLWKNQSLTGLRTNKMKALKKKYKVTIKEEMGKQNIVSYVTYIL